ncbi:MAG: c-type cytochrome [Sedimenticola sp.]
MHQKISRLLVFLSTLLLTLLASADAPLDDELSQAIRLTPNVDRGKTIFNENCSHCHGEDGWGTTDGRFPQIAGQHSSVIIKQLADIRAGNRDNPEMFPFAQESVLGGAQAVADVAAYLSTLAMDPYPEFGESSDNELENAEGLYRKHCASCHGDKGEGNALKFYPLIQGQHYEYLLRQLIWIRDGKRRNANQDMMATIKAMDDKQLQTLADYASQLMPPEEKLGKP